MLYLVATPIGDFNEITLRALHVLKECDAIICESTKEASTLLKNHDIKAKKYLILNEHTTHDDLNEILQLCRNQNMALVSDCGTPSFCDPGFQLVRLCRKENIPVKSVLGPSSLMGLLSHSSEKITSFYFRGFIPAENVAREQEWKKIKKQNEAIVLMDTPYRLKKMLEECALHLTNRKILLVLNLSQENECVLEGTSSKVKNQNPFDKAEFMILVYAEE